MRQRRQTFSVAETPSHIAVELTSPLLSVTHPKRATWRRNGTSYYSICWNATLADRIGIAKNGCPTPSKPGDRVMLKRNNISNAADQVKRKLLPTLSPPSIFEVFTSAVTVKLFDPQTGKFIRKAHSHVSQLNIFFQPPHPVNPEV